MTPIRSAAIAPEKSALWRSAITFGPILGCLLGEDWTKPRLVEMIITPDGHLLGRCDGTAAFRVFLGASDDLLRNIHGIAPVAELDGDEVGYLVGRIAEIKRKR